METISYSIKELCAILQISLSTYKNRREEVLEHLSAYCDYEEKVGAHNKKMFIITKLYNPIQPFPKYQKVLTKQQQEELMEKVLIPEIQEEPVCTASSLTRILFKDKTPEEQKQYNYSQNTFRKKASEQLLEWFNQDNSKKGSKGYIGNKVWVSLNKATGRYERLTDEQIEFFFNNFNIGDKQSKEELMAIISEYLEENEIKKADFNKIVGDWIECKYITVRKLFFEKYHKWPMVVTEKILYEMDSLCSAKPGTFAF